jgi:L-lysine exporter family protein LysE/ArgO
LLQQFTVSCSLSDTLLITLAVLGISIVVVNSAWLRTILLVTGFVFLLYMGWVSWRSEPKPTKDHEKAGFSTFKQIAFASSVSLLNPHAILDTVGVIGISSLQYSGTDLLVFGISCILVSWLWFTGLALAGRTTGKLDKSGRLTLIINKLSALVMWGSACYIGLTLFSI